MNVGLILALLGIGAGAWLLLSREAGAADYYGPRAQPFMPVIDPWTGETTFAPSGEVTPTGARMSDEEYNALLRSYGYNPDGTPITVDQAGDGDYVDPFEAWGPDGPWGATDNAGGFMGSPEQNLQAFLMMIRRAEHPEGGALDDDYRRIFGGELINDFSDHPRKKVTARFPNGQSITSDAAGAYQAMSFTWDDFIRYAGPRDFSPASQDEFAVWAIRRRGALEDVLAGRFNAAVKKVAREWASLPGSPYGQPMLSWDEVRSIYEQAGGTVA